MIDNAAVLRPLAAEDAPLFNVLEGFCASEQILADNNVAESDAALFGRVENALAKVPISPGSLIHVDAFDGVIVLTGTAKDATERSAIEVAVLAVPGVRVVAQQLETAFPSQQQPTLAEVAREALRQLRLSPPVVDPGIKLVVEHGWVRLEGVANSAKTRDEVVRRLRRLRGSRGVIDMLRATGSRTGQVVTD